MPIKKSSRRTLTIRRKAYRRSDGTRVKATTYRIKDVGTKGRRSRGSKSGRYSKQKRWISRKGKLGGPGYLSKSDAERHKILDACVRKYGYRSCLGSVMVLRRPLSQRGNPKLIKDRKYLVNKYGGQW